MSDIVLLRKLTRKSNIGFGDYKDMTIQNLLDLKRHKNLLEIYYFFRNIDYMPDILDELHIKNERVIDKKLQQDERVKKEYYFFISCCLNDIYNDRVAKYGSNIVLGKSIKEKKFYKLLQKNLENALNRTIYSKGAQRSKNQW